MSTTESQQLLEAVKTYRMPLAAHQLLSKTQPLILCGITAAGKDTVFNDLMRSGGYKDVVSHTTRQPRLNQGVMEQDGKDYYFVSLATLAEMVIAQKFIEVKAVHHDFYGTSIEAYRQVAESDSMPVLVIDVQGAVEFAAALPTVRPVFVLPPSYDVWRQRLAGRGSMTANVLKKRLQSAVNEINLVLNNPAFDLVLNDDLGSAAQAIKEHRVGRQPAMVALAQALLQAVKQALEELN